MINVASVIYMVSRIEIVGFVVLITFCTQWWMHKFLVISTSKIASPDMQ